MQLRVTAVAVATLIAVSALLVPASASADVAHVILPGETLTSVAATDGISISALAAANNMSPTAELVAGQILWIPPQTVQTVQTVQTATTRVTPSPVTNAQPSVAVSDTTPVPTDQRVSAPEIADIADAAGVPPALAEGIAWQESGWNNDVVSGAGAVGVMQIMPTAWSWIDTYLTPKDPLEPASAAENVRGGVLALHELLALTDDSYALAAAAYYQGLASIREYGLFPQTQQYVANVLALTARFGG